MAESRKEQASAFMDSALFSNGGEWEKFRDSLSPEQRETFDKLSGRREDVKKEEGKSRDEIKPEPGLPLPPAPYTGYKPSPDKDKWTSFRESLPPELRDKFNSLEERDRELLAEYRKKGRFNWVDFNRANVDFVIGNDLFRKKGGKTGESPRDKVKIEEIETEKSLHPLFQKLSKEDIDKMVFSNPVTAEQLTRVVEAAREDLFGGRDLAGEVYDGRSAAFVGVAINGEDGLTGDLVIIKEKDFFDSPVELHKDRGEYEIVKKEITRVRSKEKDWLNSSLNYEITDEGGNETGDWVVFDKEKEREDREDYVKFLEYLERKKLKSSREEYVKYIKRTEGKKRKVNDEEYDRFSHMGRRIISKEEYDKAYNYVTNPDLPEWYNKPGGVKELEKHGAVLNFHLYKAGGAIRVVRPPKEAGGRADVRDVCLLCAHSGSDVLYDWLVEKEGEGVYINALKKLYTLVVTNERGNRRLLPDDLFDKTKGFVEKYYTGGKHSMAEKNPANNWVCPAERFDYDSDRYKDFLTELMDLSREMDRLCGNSHMAEASSSPTPAPTWEQVQEPWETHPRWVARERSEWDRNGPSEKERLENLRGFRDTLVRFIKERDYSREGTYRGTISRIIRYTPFPSLVITPELSDEELREYSLELIEEYKGEAGYMRPSRPRWNPPWRYVDSLPGDPEVPYPGEPQSLMIIDPPKIKKISAQGKEPLNVLSFMACDMQTLKRATCSVTLTDAQVEDRHIFNLLRAAGVGAIVEGKCVVHKTGDKEYLLSAGELTFSHQESKLDFIKSRRYLDYEIEPPGEDARTEAHAEQERYRDLHRAIEVDEEIRGIYRHAESSERHAPLRGELSSIRISPPSI